jgi:hypothetical protein
MSNMKHFLAIYLLLLICTYGPCSAQGAEFAATAEQRQAANTDHPSLRRPARFTAQDVQQNHPMVSFDLVTDSQLLSPRHLQDEGKEENNYVADFLVLHLAAKHPVSVIRLLYMGVIMTCITILTLGLILPMCLCYKCCIWCVIVD